MNLQNIGPHLLRVAGLGIAPGRVGTMEQDAYIRWLGDSARNRRNASLYLRMVPDAPTRRGLYAAAKAKAGPDDLTYYGRPTVQFLRTQPGLETISASERDKHHEAAMYDDDE